MAKEVVNEATIGDEVLAQLVKEDGVYYIIDQDGSKNECKFDKSGDWIVFPANASNRKYMNAAKAAKLFDEDGIDHVDLTYKATKVLGPIGTRLPNSKLIAYLSEEDQAEYKAIIDRAIEAKKADKVVKPKMTEKEKLEAKLAKVQAQLAALESEEE